MNTDFIIGRLGQAQDTEADIALLRRAINCESITGNEAGFAELLLEEMAGNGLDTGLAEFLPGRPNVWGRLDGAGSGPTLLYAGHTDTVHVSGWRDRWHGREQGDPFSAAMIDGEIWGRGSCDLKGGICASLASIRLLGRAGFRLGGSVAFAFVGDEESGEPGMGTSAGARELGGLVASGQLPKPDFAVYVEPTNLNVCTAQIGFFIAEIAVRGKSSYFGTPELGVDALKAAHSLLSAIWRHGSELAAGPAHDLVGSSSILVTGIDGGGYIAVPGDCRLSLIRKLRPGEDIDAAVNEFERALRQVPLQPGISIEISYPAGRDHPRGGTPAEIRPDEPAVRLLSGALREVAGDAGAITGAPYWSESPFLINDVGCPTVYCAPGDIAVAHTVDERINAQQYLAAIRAFSLFALRYCGVCEAP